MLKKVFAGILIIFSILFFILVTLYFVLNSPSRILQKTGCNKFVFCEKNYSSWFWKEGRSFIFEVGYFGVIPVGQSEISMTNFSFDKKDYLAIKTTVTLAQWVQKAYQANITITSYVDKHSHLPFMYTENIVTPKKRSDKEIMFDQVKHIATRDSARYKILPDTHDSVSAIMMLFTEDYSKPEIVINIFSKEDPYELRAKLKEKNGDIYHLTGVMERKNKSNNAHRASFELWVKNDKVRIPLLLKVYSPAGIVCMRLKEVR